MRYSVALLASRGKSGRVVCAYVLECSLHGGRVWAGNQQDRRRNITSLTVTRLHLTQHHRSHARTHARTHTHTQTHTFNGPLSATTRVSWYGKSKTNLDFTEARDSEWQWHQLGHMQVCISLQTVTTPALHRSVFLQAECLSCRPTNSIKALKAQSQCNTRIINYTQSSETCDQIAAEM